MPLELVRSVLRTRRSYRLQLVRARLAFQIGLEKSVGRVRPTVWVDKSSTTRSTGQEIESQS